MHQRRSGVFAHLGPRPAGGPIRVRVRVRPALHPIGDRLLIRGWVAVTLGRTIVSWRPLEPRELAHEIAHVRQWRQHGGPGFVLRYLAASCRAAQAGGNWYLDNAFEREARQAAEAAYPLSSARAAPSRRP